MEITRAYIKNIWKIVASVVGFVALVVSAFAFTEYSKGTIDYYCTNGNGFLVFNFSHWAACPLAIAFGYIVVISSAIFLSGLLLYVSADGLIWVFNRARDYYYRSRTAKFLIGHVESKSEDAIEVYVFVSNEEFWFNAKEVSADAEFISNRRIKGLVKWKDPMNEVGEVSIPRKTYKTLHIATIDIKNEFISFNLIGDNERFQPPKQVFPITIQGKMFFWFIQSHKVLLNQYLDVVIHYKDKDNISVEVKMR